jgi:type 1 fimbria pilin
MAQGSPHFTVDQKSAHVVNDGGLSVDQFLPSISYSSLANSVDIMAMDRRDDTTNNIEWKMYHYHCHLNTDCTNSANWVYESITPTITMIDNGLDGTNHIGDYYTITSNSVRQAYAVYMTKEAINGQSAYRIWFNRDLSMDINAYDTSGNSLNGLAISVYNSGNTLIASGYTLLVVGVPAASTYTVDIDSYGSDQCTSSGDYSGVTSYSVASWGCQATVNAQSTVAVNGYYGTNSGSSNNLQVSSADLNDNPLTGFYIQLDNSGGTQIATTRNSCYKMPISKDGMTIQEEDQQLQQKKD